MVGYHINRLILLFIIVAMTSCSEEKKPKNNLQNVVYEYIELLGKQKGGIQNCYVKVSVDSVYLTEYRIYKMVTYGRPLKFNDLPNIIDEHNDIKIAYFIKSINVKSDIIKIKPELEIEYFYNNDSLLFALNYPEWVVLENKINKNIHVIKDLKTKGILQE